MMAYSIKRTGRPRQNIKIRNVRAIAPKGFTFQEVQKDKIIFKRKV